MELSQTRLLVADVGASVRFYRDVLGLRLNWGDETSRYASFETGAVFDRTAMAEAVTAVDPPYPPDRVVIVFGVDNMDTALGEIRERGGAGSPTSPWTGRLGEFAWRTCGIPTTT